VLDEIVQRGSGIMANRTLALIRKIFNFGVQRDIVDTNPCSGLTRPAVEQQRDRVLTDDEIRSLWRACDTEPAWVAGAIRLYLVTAQRKEEVLVMRWDEIDLTTGWWTIPAERSKDGLAHRVPLSPAAIGILQGLRHRGQSSEFVFSSAKSNAALTTIQKTILRLRARTGIDFRLHDLRRTAASMMTGMGINRLVVSKILNHVERGVTSIYDRHSYDREKREALDAWAERLDAIVTNSNGHYLTGHQAAAVKAA
jgi:integrase